MKFNPDKTTFGRHETFALRYSWLPKGFQAVLTDPSLFESDDAVVSLGVGKNMVISIRYWLRACRLVSTDTPSLPTDLGKYIFDPKTGKDPYLEDEATIWLVHWLLASNAEMATSWFWFFNMFHKPEFTHSELSTALADFVKDRIIDKKPPALATLRNDAQLLHRMYTQSKGNTRMPLEEALDSPLALLRLVTQSPGGRSFQSKAMARDGLPLGILGFAVMELFDAEESSTIPVEELMYSRNGTASPGAIFRLTETDLIAKLEKLVQRYPNYFAIRETAGIHQLYRLSETKPCKFLEDHYASVQREVAA